MKYKINNNINSTISKDTVDTSKQKKVKSEFNSKYTINIKNNKKKRIFLFLLYILAFGATTVTTILLLHNNITINNLQFNANANNQLWEEYYQQHHRDASPINLNTTNDYFKNPKNIIIFNVVEKDSKDNINFIDVLNSIDENLQKAKIENDIDNDNADQNLLPINFFANVNYNPAVKFTIGNDQAPITNSSFTLPKNFNEINKYLLHMTTNDQAPIFGINSTNLNIEININIINQIAVNLETLSLNFPKKIILINDPQHASIDDIKNKWLIPEIENQFETVLSKTLNVDKEKIHQHNYYKIEFADSSKIKDFTKFVTVNFTITSLDNNPWNFTGTKISSIDVKNDKVELSNMKGLATEIENKYNNDSNSFQITLDNQKDKDGNYINADSKLSTENVSFIKEQIIKNIKEICQSYFKQYYQDLKIEDSDYMIVINNLEVGDDIFNHKLGKNIEILISAVNTSYKLNGSLKANAIVHGHNKNNITNSYNSPVNFGLNGIWLKDGKDANILQEGQHFYAQDNLLKNWITDEESLLNTINNNAYHPDASSFSGTFIMNCQLEKEQQNRSMSADISKDITGGKATNFWELITKTKSIFLETDVTTTSGWSVNNVKLIFTDTETQPDKNNTLYTLDLSSKFAGITVSTRATLTFNDFNFRFNYQVVS